MKTEIWKSHPDIAGIEVSTLGRVRTLDRVTSSEKITRFIKGQVLKQHDNHNGYMRVGFSVNGKRVDKLVHRLVGQTFIPNLNNSPEINHLDCDPTNNNVSNLEWCTHQENIAYRDKLGHTAKNNTPKSSVFAVNLRTSKISHFHSRNEASHSLGVYRQNINAVIKGELKQTGGYWFKEDDGNGIEIDKNKLNNIVDGTLFRDAVFAVNLKTQEVSRFKSQAEASRELGVFNSNISKVLKGEYNQTGGFWFVRDNGHAVDIVKIKLHELEKRD